MRTKLKQLTRWAHIYAWDETRADRDPNIVASALFLVLQNLILPIGFQKIRLFSDGCASQNKNSAVVEFFVLSMSYVKPNMNIERYFPIYVVLLLS